MYPLAVLYCTVHTGYGTVQYSSATRYCTVQYSTVQATVALLYCVVQYLFTEGVGFEADFRAIFRLKSATQLIGPF